MDHGEESTKQPVLVIGAAGIDIVGRVKEVLNPGSSSQAMIRTSFGGVARNVAENLARLGEPVVLLSAVGEDQIGEQLLLHTVDAGVDVSHIHRTNEHPTGSYLGVLNSSGILEFALDDMRIMKSITPAYLRANQHLFESASVLFIDANLSKETLRIAFSLAEKAGLPVFADPTASTLAARLLPYLPQIDLITANSAEAGSLCGGTTTIHGRDQAQEAAKYLVSQGVETVLITMAEFGVCYATTETNGYIPAIKTEILDTTGAGDALTASVIFGYLNEIPLDDAVRLGVSAASLTLRYPGAVLDDLSLEKLYDHLVI